jgi:hypothetical protein
MAYAPTRGGGVSRGPVLTCDFPASAPINHGFRSPERPNRLRKVRVVLDDRPLWTCPGCGRSFARPNQTHTCAPLGSVDAHFAGCAPAVRATFDAVLAAVRACGPLGVLPERTRIALHVRMSFAAFMPRRRWLDGHLVLARRIDSPRFRRVEVYSPRNVLHAFRLTAPGEVDAEFTAYLAEAYLVGAQEHLRGDGPRRAP